MSAGPSGATSRVSIIRILADTGKSIQELKDLGTQLGKMTKQYMYLKHVLGNMLRSFDEVDSAIRRSTDVYAANSIVMGHTIDQYGKLSTGLTGAIGVFNQLIRTQGMTEESMVRLAVQARELSIVLGKSMDDVGKTMRELKVGLGLSNEELSNMTNTMGILHTTTGAEIATMTEMAKEAGYLSKAFGGSANNALMLASAFENATGSSQGAITMFGKFTESLKTFGQASSGLDDRFRQSAETMFKDPLGAIDLLRDALKGLSEEQRQHYIALRTFTPLQLQYLENLTQQRSEIEKSINAQARLAAGIETMSEKYARVIGGIGVQFSIMRDNLKELGNSFSVYLGPVVAGVLKTINFLLEALNKIPTPIKGLIGLIAGFAAIKMAIAPLGLMASLVAMLASSLWAAVPAAIAFTAAMAPYLLIAAAVAVTLGSVIKLLGGWEVITKRLGYAWSTFSKGFSEGLGDAFKDFGMIFEAISALFTPLQMVGDGVDKAADDFSNFGKIAGSIVKFIAGNVENVIILVGYLIAVFQDCVLAVKDMGSTIGSFFKGIFNSIFDSVQGALRKSKELYIEFLKWVGLDTSDSEQKLRDSNYAYAQANSARVWEDQQAAFFAEIDKMTAAADAIAGSQNGNTQAIIDSNKTLADAISGQTDTLITASKESEANNGVQENMGVQVVSPEPLLSPQARQAAISVLSPTYSVPPEPVTVREVANSAGNTGNVSVKIMLDEYVLGQALINMNRRTNVFSYGEPGGVAHGIR